MKISLFLRNRFFLQIFVFSLLTGVSGGLLANHGLKNLQATCYFNSVMQSLLHTRPLEQAFFTNKDTWEKDELFKGLIQLHEEVQSATFVPRDLYNLSYEYCFLRPQLSFYSGDNEDALNALITGNQIGSISQDLFTRYEIDSSYERDIKECFRERERAQDAAEFFVQFLDCAIDRENQLGLQLFKDLFSFNEALKFSPCSHCKNERQKTDLKRSLSIPVPREGNPDLNVCLASYFQEEDMNGNSQYECYSCSRKYDAKKGLFLESTPKILAITLNRFDCFGHKINTPVPFSLEDLNLQKFMLDESFQAYRLYAFIVHTGEQGGAGHYLTYAKNAAGSWSLFDDEKVIPNQDEAVRLISQSGKHQMISQSGKHQKGVPYILFYERDEEAIKLHKSDEADRIGMQDNDVSLLLGDDQEQSTSVINSILDSLKGVTEFLHDATEFHWIY